MEKTLVVMAAGMGSRFGGLKQIEPIGPSGEFLVDYSIYDAKQAGFQKIVFVIKEELLETFKNTIGKRIEDKVKVAYAFQNIEDIPEAKKYLLKDRIKPWGTVQAVLCAKKEIEGDFAVINADDFYGLEALKLASTFLDENKVSNEYACITYPFFTTASHFGSVKRGICFPETGEIKEIIESKVTVKDNYALAEPLNGDEPFKIDLKAPVSMNLFAFKHQFFNYLEEYFKAYFNNSDEYILNNEALLTELIKEKLDSKEIVLINIPTKSKWLGLTYKEDLVELKTSIKELIANGEYQERLWD